MPLAAHDVKAKLSDVLETAMKEGPQIVTREGVETAVVVPMEEWERLQASARHSLTDPLTDPNGPHDIYIPPRRLFNLRPANLED